MLTENVMEKTHMQCTQCGELSHEFSEVCIKSDSTQPRYVEICIKCCKKIGTTADDSIVLETRPQLLQEKRVTLNFERIVSITELLSSNPVIVLLDESVICLSDVLFWTTKEIAKLKAENSRLEKSLDQQIITMRMAANHFVAR